MGRNVVLFVGLLVACALAAPAYGQLSGDNQPGPVDLNRPPGNVLDPVRPIPRPITPTVTFQSEEFQLVGFTRQLFTGFDGVLNFSLACQAEFVGSRMCAVEEVNRTEIIPHVPGTGFAWVQNLSGPDAAPNVNCAGWFSNSSRDVGTAIELGQCYGGQRMMTCNNSLAIACCSRAGKVPIR